MEGGEGIVDQWTDQTKTKNQKQERTSCERVFLSGTVFGRVSGWFCAGGAGFAIHVTYGLRLQECQRPSGGRVSKPHIWVAEKRQLVSNPPPSARPPGLSSKEKTLQKD